MKILVVGNGGREHALGWKIAQSPLVKEIFFAPGNGGTAELGTNISIQPDDICGLKTFAKENQIDLTVVGPELPLSLGIVDEFKSEGLAAFGPDKSGARLESSKQFSKAFMEKYNIPTAGYESFADYSEASAYIKTAKYPLVIKADGLAAGKGVIICSDSAEAEKALKSIMVDGAFGNNNTGVVIEEFLQGKEVSLLCFTDSNTIVPMESASDYKRAYDGDKGPNTGGMGSISPSPYYESGSCDYIANRTLEGIKAEGMDVKGVVYIGLMLTTDGPKVLEYNMRFGDPETQALLTKLDSDLIEIIIAIMSGKLNEVAIKWNNQKAVTVIMASKGYPGGYETGYPIQLADESDDVVVFHSATKFEEGRLLSNGGRVLAVTALGEDMQSAREKVYAYLDKTTFENGFYRKDIGV